MTTGTGTAAQFGFAIETVRNTRQVPNRFMPFVQEAIKTDQAFIRSAGLRAGRRQLDSKRLGNKSIAGSINMELQTETIGDLLRLCMGGTVTPTGAGPYVRTYTGGILPSATFQLGRPTNNAAAPVVAFDYIGTMVNTWTLAGNAGEDATLQLEVMARDEIIGQTLGTYAESAAITVLTANTATITPFGGAAVCFDSWSIQGSNSLEALFKACAADTSAAGAGLATIREAGVRSITGTLQDDFKDMTQYNRYLAGTEGALVIALDGGASAKLLLTLKVFFTGETPNVGGPSVVKQGIPFEVISGTSDADAITLTLTNTDAS